MNVIGHYHVSPDEPGLGLMPCTDDFFGGVCCSKDRFPILAANRQKYNDRFVMPLDRRHVRRMFTAGI